MQLTSEQQAILNSTGNIKINAVAGSGKTSTIIEYAKTRPKNCRILYLVFNKSVKLEAEGKFKALGLNNVKVETAHSLAYKYIISGSKYKVKLQGFKTHEIPELLAFKGNGEKHMEFIVANHINKFITYFCNSIESKIQDLDYRMTIADKKAKAFVNTFYKEIEKNTRILLGKMDTAEIEVTHDFYLKKFQLSNPKLPFDYILFDEGQDASATILDIFLKQNAIKVIVGDTHQQIYSWRYATNSLEKVNFTTFNLSTSFRFSQDVANLGMRVLKLKEHISEARPVPIFGKGNGNQNETKAVLARTNLGLLLKAIEYVTEKKKVKNLYFEGNINSYTYAEDGASLYDVLNLYNNKRGLIKDKIIKTMKDMVELEEYIKKTEDVQLGLLAEIVNEYGNEIPKIINEIKNKHVENDKKAEAELIFSTVHRCKGMEYDCIHLVNDFITEKKLEKLSDDEKDDKAAMSKLNEEINLLYVAITRTKNMIYIPESILPVGFPSSPQIKIIKDKAEEKAKPKSAAEVNKKSYTVNEVRENYISAYESWTDEMDDELTDLFCEGISIRELALHFGRTKGAISSRIKRLELRELYG